MAVVLAAGAGVAFLAARVLPADVESFVFLVGVALLAWAAIADGVLAVHLIRSAARGRAPAVVDVALTLSAAALITVILVTHPLAGGGSGAG